MEKFDTQKSYAEHLRKENVKLRGELSDQEMRSSSIGQQIERMDTQMTLGELIAQLKGMDGRSLIQSIGNPHCYRGYYRDLAFERLDGYVRTEVLLSILKGCIGETFEGWKGGDYLMGKSVPIWIADEGSCGLRVISLSADGEFEKAEDTF